MEFPDVPDDELRICSLDRLKVGETYEFDPALHIAMLRISSKHRLGNPPKLRRPNFLEEDLIAYGVRKGTLVSKSPWEGDSATGIFACEARFKNKTTDQMETVRYNATCKFSRRSAQGIQVEVRRLVQDLTEGQLQTD